MFVFSVSAVCLKKPSIILTVAVHYVHFVFLPQIDNEEYGEALSLAQAYNLDSDLVYQRQWRKSTVSIASIQDYLVR